MPLRALVDLAERGEPVPPKSVVITFDDGYASVYEHAWPMLRQLEIPATIFLASGFIDSRRPFPFDPWAVERETADTEPAWLPLSWSQCREMQGSDPITVGTHTHTHRNFRGRPAEFEDDLRTSIDMIGERMGRQPDLFSFPFGGRQAGIRGTGPRRGRRAARSTMRIDHRDRTGRTLRVSLPVGQDRGIGSRFRRHPRGQARGLVCVDGTRTGVVPEGPRPMMAGSRTAAALFDPSAVPPLSC